MTDLGLTRKDAPTGALVETESARATQEVQAALVIAKKFPRDQDAAYLRIMKACERFSLAEQAEYAYPRGDKTVVGPTIRLAEVLAQNWGNMQFGIKELSQDHNESEIEAFAWDLETNTRQIKTFSVPHKRYSKKKGNEALTDPRDIYEHTANMGARRMRACILGVIPGDIVEAAQKKCAQTVRAGIRSKPLSDQVRDVLQSFEKIGVIKAMIEDRLGHATDIITEDELVELKNIGRSIKDNITSRDEWFNVKAEREAGAADLTDQIKTGTTEPANVSYADTETVPVEQTQPSPEVEKTGVAPSPEVEEIETAPPQAPPKTDGEVLFDKIMGARSNLKGLVLGNLEKVERMAPDMQANIKKRWESKDGLGEWPIQGPPVTASGKAETQDNTVAAEIEVVLGKAEKNNQGLISTAAFCDLYDHYSDRLDLETFTEISVYDFPMQVPHDKREGIVKSWVEADMKRRGQAIEEVSG